MRFWCSLEAASPQPSPAASSSALQAKKEGMGENKKRREKKRKEKRLLKESGSKKKKSREGDEEEEDLKPKEDEKDDEIWVCPRCNKVFFISFFQLQRHCLMKCCSFFVKVDDGTPMIGCDECEDWYHWVCVGE